MIKNLGQVAAIYVGKTAPRNVNMIWLDNTVIPYVFKSYNGEEWAEIPTGAWVETYVNGWLVSLQQGTVTTDDDYLLINSGGVNYKMTVRDFVKSSVGNPLDFKGVIRTDSDFPNPSTLEGGDMYIIITEPAGGTVTDPYSGKTFSDSEKIVWDSVINGWASLGKIDVKVDLSTTYSATEVTIHSSAGKETTVVGVTDDNAGVMVPVQKKWLDSLSNGSTLTPQEPLTAPYHKHRYSDIVDRIISQQVTGDSAINPMSQKATTEALNLKLDKSSVLQVSGVSTTDVMSQKAVTDAIQTLKSNVDDKLSRYLPLSGGTMTGTITLNNGIVLRGIGLDGNSRHLIGVASNSNRVSVGATISPLTISSSNTAIIHTRGSSSYDMYDTYNLPDPAKLSADQTFTGTNNFTAGKFNVAGNKSKFSVNNVGGLRMYYDYADEDTGISRYLDFYTKTSSDTDYKRRGIFGLYISKSTPNSDYAYIGAGDVGSEDAQYRFFPNIMKVPDIWSMYLNGGSTLLQSDVTNIYLAASNKNTIIRSNNSDLYHRKTTTGSTTDYKIWDESNLPSPASTTDLSKYALLAGDNTFTSSNTFNKTVSVVGSGTISLNPNTGINYKLVSTSAARGYSITLGTADDPHTTTFGSVLTNQEYAYIALPGTDYGSTPYRFLVDQMTVPNTFRLLTKEGVLLLRKDSNGVQLGSGSSNTFVNSFNSDLTHRKYTASSTYTDYKIWDASNLPSPASSTDLDSYLTKTEASTTYYPIGGRGFLSFDASGRPIMNNNQGYSVRDKDSTAREVLWMDTVNNLSLGNTSSWTLPSITFRATNVYWGNSLLATRQWVTDNFSGGGSGADLLPSDNTWSGTNTYGKNIILNNNISLASKKTDGSLMNIASINTSDVLALGNIGLDVKISSGYSDLIHKKSSGEYKIWDAYNVSSPLDYMKGAAGQVAGVSGKEISINGVNQTHIVLGLGGNGITLFAPTTAGISGQVLQSQGAGKAPIWVNGGTGGGVQLSDTNVWTGLNTFQGGLKTSDGTNSYDVWDNNSLKYPVKYAINSTGTGYALSFYSKTAGWKEIDTLTTKYLTSATVKSISSGGDGYIGIESNAYASAAISAINTNSIYFRGLNSTVLSTNDDGKLEYGSSSNYAGFNSGNIRIAYPIVSSSGGGGGGGGGTTDPSEGGLTIGYYPVNTIGKVTERAKIYCTTANLYLKDLAKNTQLDFDTDGLYVTTGSTSKVRLATLNDISGGGSGVSLDGNNTWTGVNIFSGTGLVTNQYDSGNTETPATANYSIRLACGGSYDNYGFGAVRSKDRVKQSYAFVQTPSAFFTFDNSGSLYTTIGNTKYEFWNKQNLAKPIVYNTNSDGDGVLYKGDSTANRIDSLELVGILPPTNNAVTLSNGGTGKFGNVDNAYAEAYIGNVHANNVTTTTIVVPGSENYFEFKEDGLHFYDIVNQEEYKINMTKV